MKPMKAWGHLAADTGASPADTHSCAPVLPALRRGFCWQDVRQFSQISSDTNRLHLDEDYAATTRFGRCIVHGVLLNGYVTRGTVVGCRLVTLATFFALLATCSRATTLLLFPPWAFASLQSFIGGDCHRTPRRRNGVPQASNQISSR